MTNLVMLFGDAHHLELPTPMSGSLRVQFTLDHKHQPVARFYTEHITINGIDLRGSATVFSQRAYDPTLLRYSGERKWRCTVSMRRLDKAMSDPTRSQVAQLSETLIDWVRGFEDEDLLELATAGFAKEQTSLAERFDEDAERLRESMVLAADFANLAEQATQFRWVRCAGDHPEIRWVIPDDRLFIHSIPRANHTRPMFALHDGEGAHVGYVISSPGTPGQMHLIPTSALR